MQITTFYFFIFTAISLLIYYLLPQKLQWFFLLCCSLAFFFLNSTPYTFVYMLASIGSVFLATNYFSRLEAKMAAGSANEKHLLKKKKCILVIALVINFGILAVLKYTNLGISTINIISSAIFKHDSTILKSVHWIAPLAISYYTLQLSAYLLDCYWGVAKAYTNPLKLGLYTCYFPQMTTGPISRYSQIGSQLFDVHRFDYERVTFGLQRVIWGLFKKLVIAERLALLVNPVYENVAERSGIALWCASALFVLQLYMDFSGGMDIILGVSECFGIFLPENFRNPFFATSIQEFWQRWHITLGTWLKDYIMYPVLKSNFMSKIRDFLKTKLGKKVAKKVPTYIGMLALWLAMGLWHGSGWKYIVGEGIWFWLVICLGEIFEEIIKKLINLFHVKTDCFSWRLFQRIRTFVIVCIGLIFFRADSLHNAFVLLKRALLFVAGSGMPSLESADVKILVVSLAVWFLFAVLSEKEDVRKLLAKQNIWFRWGVYIMIIFVVFLLGVYGSEYDDSGFLYQQF